MADGAEGRVVSGGVDSSLYDIQEVENIMPGDAGRVTLAGGMEERCKQ